MHLLGGDGKILTVVFDWQIRFVDYVPSYKYVFIIFVEAKSGFVMLYNVTLIIDLLNYLKFWIVKVWLSWKIQFNGGGTEHIVF